MKNNKILLTVFIFIIISIISNFIVCNTSISSYSVFDTTNLFTYFGVLIGFALTIYTFGLSMVSDLKSKVESVEKFTPEDKMEIYKKLVCGFKEIKGDIWLIFYSIIIVIYFTIAREVTNPFGWDVEELKIPETVNLTLFITSTIAMWDIMRTLFNLSEINLELSKNDKTSV